METQFSSDIESAISSQEPRCFEGEANKLTNLNRLAALSGSVGFRVPATRALAGQHFVAALRSIGCPHPNHLLVETLTNDTAQTYRQALLLQPLPSQTVEEIQRIFDVLNGDQSPVGLCARSCFEAEDHSQQSFAGAFDTVLAARSVTELCRAVQVVYASVFSERAITAIRRSDAEELPRMSVALQVMVGGEGWYGGVAHTQDIDLSPLAMMLVSVSGDSASVTSGAFLPEDYLVYRPNLRRADRKVIVQRRAGSLTGSRFRFSDLAMRTFAQTLLGVEKAFGFPLEIEWQCSNAGTLYLLQARPLPSSRVAMQTPLTAKTGNQPICTGLPVGNGSVTATVQRVDSAAAARALSAGCIIVTRTTDPEWNPVIRGAAGLVTEVGGRTSHVSRVAREEGVLAIVGCGPEIRHLESGMTVTLVCAEGISGEVYPGHVALDTRVRNTDTLHIDRPAMALTLSRIHSPSKVVLDLTEILWSLRIPDRLRQCDADSERLRRRFAGHPSLEAFVTTRYAESISLVHFAFPSAEIVVTLKSDCDWRVALQAAIAQCQSDFGVRVYLTESAADQTS